ncbi:outer membrane receptor protein involved in Fe transport [Chitinophaga dinghuensis]|uniref:Outer membrane receptor protein involved in Fe transport n=1 Tax=Chitinophaga dinghuensis TaxID=1539050 RepID=A0A327VQV2_9BACT|nr:outer membrane beta-barrel protein [Chitinophaga dinghuensis]RAJ77615.1 outer membrane receptor protein involved in Fe transport [Chitinophaga dinghuensis]
MLYYPPYTLSPAERATVNPFLRHVIKILLLLLLLLHSSLQTLYAQTPTAADISGTIVNSEGTPLRDAVVLLKRTADSVIYKTALSNEQGVFAFSAVKTDNYFIEINILGFEKLRRYNLQMSSTAISLGKLPLQSASNNLTGVEVRARIPLIERQIDKTVVNVENSIISEGANVLEVMERLPGVQVDQNGVVAINGKRGVMVFMDGKAVMMSPEDIADQLRGMASSSISKIEIIAKPGARYDAAGSGGIINIVRKKVKKDGFNGSVNAGFGQSYYSRYNAGFNLSWRSKYYNFFFNGSYQNNKNFFINHITNDILNNDGLVKTRQHADNDITRGTEAYNPAIGAEFYLSKRTTLSLTGIGGIQLAKNTTDSKAVDYDGKLSTGSQDFNSIVHDKPINYTLSMHLAHKIDSTGREISCDLDYSNYWSRANQDIKNRYYDVNSTLMNEENSFFDQHRKLNIYAAKIDYTQLLKNNARLEFGWKSSYVDIKNDNKFFNKVGGQNIIDSSKYDNTLNQENINALYVNLNKEYEKLSFLVGLRAEHTWNINEQQLQQFRLERNYVQLFPSLFIDYKLNKNQTLNMKISRRTDRPVYSQLNPFRRPLSPTLFYEGNPNLQPQTSVNSELTWAYKDRLFITFGYDNFQNYIGTVPRLDSNQVTITRLPTNIHGSYSFNFDIVYTKQLLRWWNTSNAISFYRQAFNGMEDDYVLNNNGILSFNFDAINTFILSKTFSAECSFKAVSQHRVIATTFGGYYILSAGVKQMVLGNKGSVAFKVTNILQSEDEGSTYSYKNLNQYWLINFYSRAATINFTYRFGKGKAPKMRTESGSADEQRRSKGGSN